MVSCKQENPADIRTLHRTGSSSFVPDTHHPATERPETVPRTVCLRLYPGDAATGILPAAIAGARRHVWNHRLADQERRYRLWQMYRIGPKPRPHFFTLGRRVTQLRTDHAWLKEYPFACVRYALKCLADACKRYLKDPQTEGQPRFKARYFTVPAFTIPEAVKLDRDRLHVPKVGWLRLAGWNPYADGKPLTVRVRMEGTESNPKWYAHVCCAVPVEQVRQSATDGALGLDRNAGLATDSEGTVYALSDTDQLDAQIARNRGWGSKDKRPQSNRGRRVNGLLQKLHRKRRRRRDNATHQASRTLADTAHTVAVEDLNTKGMTACARGTRAEPGTNVKAKAGLNRAILASGWRQLERKLAYKAGHVVKVDPAYTSQTCSRCGHVGKANRPSPAVFACQACGWALNADHNAAINILVRAGLPPVSVPAHGTGAAAGGGAIPSGTPGIREPGMPTAWSGM